MNLSEFRRHLRAPGVVVYFTASWCEPCRKLKETINTMIDDAPEYIKFLIIDVDESPEVAEHYRIKSMPTFHFYVNGRQCEEYTFSGASKSKLREAVDMVTARASR
jgi:thioredoxin-like negative regulator of GroEL